MMLSNRRSVWSHHGGDLDNLIRRRGHVSYFMEPARLAARAAMRAGDEFAPAPAGSVTRGG
jgi:hypothetical protein